ncbi:MAG: stage III sporulation protein AE [Firmicutes bacterium]|nr:stage III sporulation protein AE [Bacillota bacterium]
MPSVASVKAVTADDGSAPAEKSAAEKDLSKSIDGILEELDLSGIEQFVHSFDSSERSVFGGGSAADRIRAIVSGDINLNYGNFFSYLLEVVGVSVLWYLPMMLAILAIAIAVNILHSVKGKNGSESVGNIVNFAGVALVAAILAVQITMLMVSARGLIESLKAQMNVVFPIILTLMAASGGVASAGVYQPAVAVLASGIMEILVALVLPLFILSSVFTVVGNLSDTVRLKKMSAFFMTACKWLLGTAFFLFIAFLSVQGITASVYDGVSVRTAKFAISKYVPVIGGYLSEGFNLVMAGSVLVKNAVGMTAVVVLFLSVVPVLASVAIFNLTLHLSGAIAEPLGDKRISNILSELAKNTGTLFAVLLGAAFLYFVFLILVICTGNVAL